MIILNIKNAYRLLALVILVSALLSVNPRASFFYGGILDHNVVVYVALGAFIYLLNTFWSHKYKTIRLVITLYIPCLMTMTAMYVLYTHIYWDYMDWALLTTISFVTAATMMTTLFDARNKIIMRGLALSLAVVSILLAMTGEISGSMPESMRNNVSGALLTHYKVSYGDLRPDTSTSLSLLGDTIVSNLFLGVGPNQFSSIWYSHRPTSTIVGQYYNYNPDQPATTFYKLALEIGIGSILVLVIAILKIKELYSIRKDKEGIQDSRERNKILVHMVAITVSTLLIIFVSNDFLFFVYYVLLIGTPTSKNENSVTSYKNILAFIILVVCILLIVCKYYSYKSVDKVLTTFNADKDYLKLQSGLNSAGNIYTNQYVDGIKAKAYIQEASELYTATVNKKQKENTSNASSGSTNQNSIVSFNSLPVETQKQISNLVDKAINSATLSVYKNINKPDAYLLRASIYQAALTIATGTNYELAKADYDRAISLDPYNPDNMISLSKLEYVKGKRENTAALIDKMLSIKYNYLPAYMTLVDILESEGKINQKILVLEEALKSDMSNQNLAYSLAHEYLRAKRFGDYVLIIEALIKFNPNIEALQKELAQVKSDVQTMHKLEEAKDIATSTKRTK